MCAVGGLSPEWQLNIGESEFHYASRSELPLSGPVPHTWQSPGMGDNEMPLAPSGAPLIHPARLQVAAGSATISTSHTENSEASQCKKRRTEEEEEVDNDDATSTYSLNDMTQMDTEAPKEDEGAYTVVTHHKNRATGIPVVFRPIAAEDSFWKVNPNRMASEIISAINEKVTSSRINRDGSFCVGVRSLYSANKLLLIKSLAGLPVHVMIPQSYMKTLAKIRDVPLEYSDYDLLEYLKDAGVISVTRQKRWARNEDGSATMQPIRNVILQFRHDMPLPKRVALGFTVHTVEEYIEPAVRCYNCQRYGHKAKTCRGTKRCKVCAGAHDYKECTSKRQPKCANCAGPHPASFSGCSRNRLASAAQRERIVKGYHKIQRGPAPNADIVEDVPAAQRNAKQWRHDSYSEVLKRSAPKHRVGKEVRAQEHAEVELSAGPDTAKEPLTTKGKGHSSLLRKNSSRNAISAETAGNEQVILPIIFAALKAILRSLPQAGSLPEVKLLLDVEHLLLS